MGCSGSASTNIKENKRKGSKSVGSSEGGKKPFFTLDDGYEFNNIGEDQEMHVRRITNEKELHEVEVMLFVECMMKEVDIDPSISETFESRLAREVANDNGEELIGEVGFLLVQEFRKFMYKNAIHILR